MLVYESVTRSMEMDLTYKVFLSVLPVYFEQHPFYFERLELNLSHKFQESCIPYISSKNRQYLHIHQ